MDQELIREYCLNRKGVTEGFPFDETTLVFKLMGRMFALLNLDEEPSVNLKCDPEEAVRLREHYETVMPGFHMNKLHWNTILLNGRIPPEDIKEWIDNSYELVKEKLPKRIKEQLGAL